MIIVLEIMVALSGFEPESPAPKAGMIDHYTTGLLFHSKPFSYLRLFQAGMLRHSQ